MELTLLEDRARVEAWDRVLKADPARALEHGRQEREAWRSRGIEVLDPCGWPLRPLFIPRSTLDFLCGALLGQLEAFRQVLLRHVDDPPTLARHLGLDPHFLDALDLRSGLESPDFFAVLRPDGFLYEHEYLLSEINFGNGALVSNAYSETITSLLAHSPVLQALGWDGAGLDRPFQAFLRLVDSLLADCPRPWRVAMLAHRYEYETLLSWPPRVIQQVQAVQRALEARHIDAPIVHQDGLTVDADGTARVAATGDPVQGVIQFTIGSSFLEEPENLQGPCSYLRGGRIGRAFFLKPLAGLLFEKGCMPWMQQVLPWPVEDGHGFALTIGDSHWPVADRLTEYRLGKTDWVLKRSWLGADTHIGVVTPGRVWNRTVESAVQTGDYMLQRYRSLPRTILPVTTDDQHVEWIPVRVELSPFIIDNRYAGAIARYAPEAEGLRLSPPPDGMGMTCVYAV